MTTRRHCLPFRGHHYACSWQDHANGHESPTTSPTTLCAMPKRVAIAGNSPTWRRGIAAVLADADFIPVECPVLAEWKPGRDGVAVILEMESDGAAEALAFFCQEHPHIPIVAVVEDAALTEFAAVVRSGAAAVLGEDEPTEVLVSVLRAALDDRASIPREILQSMAARVPAAPAGDAWVTAEEASWLQALAVGTTVAGLADDIGFSEREMFRNLHELYVRIGVGNRTEAIVWATRHGVLD